MLRRGIVITVLLLLISHMVVSTGGLAAESLSADETAPNLEIEIPKSRIELSLEDKPRLVTRGEISHFLVEALGFDVSNEESNFKDVPKDHLYYREISTLSNLHIVNGFADGTFHPEDYVTRGHFAIILSRILDLKYSETTTTSINDVREGTLYYVPIVTVVNAGLMKLDESGNFRPHDILQMEPKGKLIPIITPEYSIDHPIIWSSSNPEIAEVDEAGQVTPKSVGKAIITVRTADRSAQATSEVTAIDETTSETYKEWEPKQNVPADKDWTIQFNDKLDEKTITEENIYLQSGQTKLEDIEISLNQDGKSIKVAAPDSDYRNGETYILYIEKGVTSLTSKPLNMPVKFEFTIE